MSEWLSSKRQQVTSDSKNVEERELLYTVGGIANWCSPAENEFPQQIKNKTSI